MAILPVFVTQFKKPLYWLLLLRGLLFLLHSVPDGL